MEWIKFYPDQEERAKKTWKYTHEKLMPLEPNFTIFCPFCFMHKLHELLSEQTNVREAILKALEYASNVSYKHRNVFHPYPNQYRIDMFFKCMNCYNIFIFGVPIDENYFKEIGAGTMHVRNVLR